MIKPDFSIEVPNDLGNVHFIGIGGSGMSGLARLLLQSNHVVTGSDVRGSKNIDDLIAIGAHISIGHDAKNIGAANTVVVTSALWETNPELLRAQELGLAIIHRSQLLASLANRKRLIAVAGAHGKTTSAGMVITALKNLNADPSFVNGGVIAQYRASSGFGSGELFVIEADESDGSFLHYETDIALITNVDPDHLDHYGSLEAFEQGFIDFADKAKELVVISGDDIGAVSVTGRLAKGEVLSFGKSDTCDIRVHNIDSTQARVSFSLSFEKQDVQTELTVAGEHNAVNAAGAVAVLVGLGFDFEKSVLAVTEFAGTDRRFELHGEVSGVSVYDDFAHHPTEVEAALKGARAVVGKGRLITVFQPHLFSRTRIFQKEFAAVLALSDEVVVTDIYAARENPEPGVTGMLIVDHFENPKAIHYVPDWDEVPKLAASLARPGDFIVTMGCGDIYRMCPELLQALEK